MVAVDILDENVLRGRLDADTFVTVGDFNVVQVAIVCADDIDAICTADVWSALGTSIWMSDLLLQRTYDGNLISLKIRNLIEYT